MMNPAFIKNKKAFTMVEMLMAIAILSVLTYGLYTLFSRTVQNVDVADWKSRAQTKLRTATKQLFKDVGGATYPATIKLNDTVVEKDTKWNLKFKDGNTTIKGSSDTLLEFYMCTPGRDIPDDQAPQKIIKFVLKADNESPIHARLMYEKTVEKGTAASVEDAKKTILAEDVVYFDAKLIKAEDATSYDASNKVKYLLRIEIQCAHTRYPKTIVTEFVEIPLLVKTNNEDPKS
jgi:prepilin-type N-terminal cleavage/methylation domain-containing protein